MEREGRYADNPMSGGGGGGGGHYGGQMRDHNKPQGAKKDTKFIPGKVFLGGLSPDTNTESLQAYCAQWGELSDVHIMLGKNYGFVTFQDPKDAQKFLDHRDHTINGKQVDAKAAVPKDQGGGRLTKKLFVGGIVGVSDDDFRDYFAQFGRIEKALILRKPDGSSRGYGFVTYEDEISVEKCLVQEHTLNNNRLDCKRANAKDQGGQGGGGGGGYHQQGMGGGAMMGGGGPNAQAMMGGMPMMGMMGGTGMPMMMPMMGMGGMPGMMGNPMMSGGGGGGQGGGGGGRSNEPQWVCSECGNKNFAFRNFCNKCRLKRPGGGGGRGGGGGNMGGMGAGMGPGGAGMMMGPGGAAGMGGMGGMQMPMGMMGNAMGGGGMAGMNPAAAMGQGMNPMMGGMMGAAGMGMMQGMDGSGMGNAMMGGGMQGMGGGNAGDDGSGGGGGGYGRMGGRGGNTNGQNRFRPY